MKKLEISAFDLDEAEQIALDQGIRVIGNVTISWKKEGSPINGVDLEIFGYEALTDAKINKIRGVGLIIEVVPGRKNKKDKPFRYYNVPICVGSRKRERVYEVRLKGTHELLGWESTKPKAYALAKKLMPSVRKHMYCVITYRIKDNKGICFNLHYSPSYGTRKGRYIVFGLETAN